MHRALVNESFSFHLTIPAALSVQPKVPALDSQRPTRVEYKTRSAPPPINVEHNARLHGSSLPQMQVQKSLHLKQLWFGLSASTQAYAPSKVTLGCI